MRPRTGSRRFAAEAAKRAPGPAARILLGRAQLAAGEVAAGRMSLLARCSMHRSSARGIARGHLELARAASEQGDEAGTGLIEIATAEAAKLAARDHILSSHD